MLTKQAMIHNLNKRYILICRLFLMGYLKPRHVESLRSAGKKLRKIEALPLPKISYPDLQYLETKISKIEDNI